VPRSSRRLAAALMVGASTLACLLAGGASASAESLPDLSVKRTGPTKVYADAQYLDTFTVTNHGTAAAPGVVVNYRPVLSVSPDSKGLGCTGIYQGHSGRGGGYTQVGWACTPTLPAGLAPGASVTVKLLVTAGSPGSINESFGVAPSPEAPQLNLFPHSGGDVLSVVLPAVPATPTGVTASKSGDGLKVKWVTDPATAKAITYTTVTLAPTGGSAAPTLTGRIGGTGTSGVVGPVVPLTTYMITVVSTDAAGSSPASSPVSFTTPLSKVPPSAPLEVRTWWLSPNAPTGSWLVGWAEGSPGDSAIDQYQITATPGEAEAASPLTNIEPASSRESEFTGYSETSWSMRVRAHNAAGWGAWTTPALLGGI
jgi:hypothetical protein